MTGTHHISGQITFAIVVPQGEWGVAYIMPRFEYLAMVENTDKFHITLMTCGPSLLEALARDPSVRDGRRSLPSLRLLGVAGARVRKTICQDLIRSLELGEERKLLICDLWGMTEYDIPSCMIYTGWLTAKLTGRPACHCGMEF